MNGKRLHITRKDMLVVAEEADIRAKVANEIIDQTIEVLAHFGDYVADTIPEWMKQPIQRQLDIVRNEL